MSQSRSLGPSTRSVHSGSPAAVPGASVTSPIFQASTFFSDPEAPGEVLYTRYGNNPNQTALERRIAALESAEDCAVLGSGMAAITCALLAIVGAGDHVVAARALYGGTRLLLEGELARLGIETTFVDVGEPGWESALRGQTRVLLIEVPTNPLIRVIDVAPIAELARRRDIALVVDATFATPINFRPLEHGAHLVVHSATKYLGGHSDVTAGAVAGQTELVARVRDRAQAFGPALDPHAAWLTERGMKTLAVRVERHNRNGMQVAQWCEAQLRIARVHYPGLGSHPDHELASRLFDGFGGMMGLEISGGAEAASRFVRALRLAKLAPSLGGVETLVSEPRHTSHVSLSTDERRDIGIEEGFVRFSLGIEDAEDIIADIEQALAELD